MDTSKTEALRRVLRQATAPMCARDLGDAAGVPVARVSALLKAEITKGRVEKMRDWGGTVLYRLGDLRASKIESAIKFLEGHGYTVLPRGDVANG